MGLAKRMLEQSWEDERVALELLRRAGVVEECEPHETVYDTGGDVEEAYRLANTLITSHHPLVAGFEGERRRATDAIKEAFDALPIECGMCAKNAEE